MYQALKDAKIKAQYEGKTFVVSEGFNFPNTSIERCANGRGDFKDRGNKKILPIKYTPDFIGDGFIIECKGRANESFPIRWKLFKKVVSSEHPHVIIYKPQNQKECDDNNRVNPALSKRIARQKYGERQIDKWCKWSWEYKK